MDNLEKNLIGLKIGLVLTLMLLSCSTMKLEEYLSPKGIEYEESSQVPGLFLIAKPMMSTTDLEQHFGVNLVKNNILAIYITAWNRNPNKSYIIYEETIKILQDQSDDKSFHPEAGDESMGKMATALASPAIFFPELFFPLLVFAPIGVQQHSDAQIIKDNFETNKFRSTTLEPGEREDGFVYFNWSSLKNYSNVDLCLGIIEAKSSDSYNTCMKVSIKGEDND